MVLQQRLRREASLQPAAVPTVESIHSNDGPGRKAGSQLTEEAPVSSLEAPEVRRPSESCEENNLQAVIKTGCPCRPSPSPTGGGG